jgi:hypothetical protein
VKECLNSKWQCALYRRDCKFFLRSYLTVCCCASPVAVVSSPAERGRLSSLADGLLSVLLRTLLLEARDGCVSSLRCRALLSLIGLGLSGVDHSHHFVVNGRLVVVPDGSEGVCFVHIDDSHGSEVLTELIEVVVAVEEGTTLTKKSLHNIRV